MELCAFNIFKAPDLTHDVGVGFSCSPIQFVGSVLHSTCVHLEQRVTSCQNK